MKIKELNKLIQLLNKFKNEPDYAEFDDNFIVDDVIEVIETYKDFLGDDNV